MACEKHVRAVSIIDRLGTSRAKESVISCWIPEKSRAAGGRMKAEGLKPGVPDLCLPVARGGFHGLYIELKAQGGRPTANQEQWIEKLTAQGYLAKVCVGFESAQHLIESYLKGEIVREV